MTPINRRQVALRLLQLAAFLALPRSAGAAVPAGPFGVEVERDMMIAMRDHVRLATDIYFPTTDGRRTPGPFPAILERTPYGKSQAGDRHASIAVAETLASQGYVVVYQDCRGRGGSEGAYVKYLSDGADGYDCCAWILSQAWSNGRIGTMGLSYAAHTQAALASAGAPGITAMFMDSGGFSNAYQGGIRQGGAFELKQATWAFNQMLEAPEIRSDPAMLAALRAIDLKDWFARMPWTRGHSPLSLAPEYEDYVFDQWEHGAFDDYWRQVGIYAQGYYDRFPDAAIMMLSSWYDPYPRTVTDNYLGLKARGNRKQALVLGPWTHGDRERTYAGDVDFGPQAAFAGNVAESYLAFKLRWFDRHLKNADGADEPDVRLFVMGGGSGRRNPDGRLDHGGSWRTEPAWPLARARKTPFFLHADGALRLMRPKTPNASRSYDYDPRAPVPSIGGGITSGAPIMAGGAFDQREAPQFFGATPPYTPLADRPDVLVFQTAPLESDVEVTGPIQATLWIASNCPDTDFTIKLIDVHPPSEDYPDGYAMNITDGILRCRYRNSWEHPRLMRPNTIHRIKIEAFPTSNLFKTGHRIRLDVSSSNFPHFDANPNTGEPEGRWTRTRVATNRVFLDARRPSHVTLPVV
ncbi:MAG: CocE/NonD family hydrolase [Hyphomonadaceae bacterium]|nr:CocE/NonD family hydrolase [Hyphomonadaceae bacterium]